MNFFLTVRGHHAHPSAQSAAYRNRQPHSAGATSPAGPAFDRGPLIDAGHDVGLLDKIKKGWDTTTDRDLLRCLRQLVSYDADQITTMFVTAHRWTEYVKNWLSRVKHHLKSSSG